jgi:hypothetical protein
VACGSYKAAVDADIVQLLEPTGVGLFKSDILLEAGAGKRLTGSSGLRSADLITSTMNAWIGISASPNRHQVHQRIKVQTFVACNFSDSIYSLNVFINFEYC